MSDMASVEINIQVQNFERVHGKLSRYPKHIDMAIRDALKEYYDSDFKPMLNRILKGFRAVNVPAHNSPRWASIKASVYGVHHSLGILTGKLHTDAMAVEGYIIKIANKTQLEADFSVVPKAGYPYLTVVHEGGDGLTQPYPFVEAARFMTHKKLLKRLESKVSQAWDKKGG